MVSAEFEQKAAEAKNLPSSVSQDDMLALYALYKQATVGDNPAKDARPGVFNLKGRYKWDAWEKLRGMSQAEAEKKYIALVDELVAKYA
ncbi:hypothetical protein TBLA_0G01360 [Henningerozyma blattae CBS 6284]|uniref:ACB domain-containing protein n=1 Tax=Henningerozyma blattae (strain ATCC 34711 / CBS 6284 / DSM 70876 / NBRC 10599 / NRRL Y-10934 / UCD 77-7) TaxID=1071380 RepID=I2H6T0_HENB6|nr:hypothetical protein TBLA_0G01360 [Tetrapisispora blattae CBS 6284]CCH62082.1 hypothetical protein TBLA_0G01360 [Tetrapisispora blattae CBS 6284]